MGMSLGLGVLVADVSERGLAMKCGVKKGDQICQVYCIIYWITFISMYIDQSYYSDI